MGIKRRQMVRVVDKKMNVDSVRKARDGWSGNMYDKTTTIILISTTLYTFMPIY